MDSPGCAATVPTADAVRGPLVAFGQAHPEITRLVLFGSLARGDTHAESDVDVVASFAPESTPQGWAHFAYLDDLEAELAACLGRSVDIIGQGAVESAERRGNHALPWAVRRDGILIYKREL